MSRQHSSVTLRSFSLDCGAPGTSLRKVRHLVFSASSCRFKPSISVRIRASGLRPEVSEWQSRGKRASRNLFSPESVTLSRSRSKTKGTERSSNLRIRFHTWNRSPCFGQSEQPAPETLGSAPLSQSPRTLRNVSWVRSAAAARFSTLLRIKA